MPFIPIPETVQIAIRGLLDNQLVENVFYATGSDGWDAPNMDALGAAVIDWCTNQYANILPSALQFVSVVLRDMESENGVRTEYPFPTVVTGADTGGAMPANVSFAVHKTSTVGGVHSKARVYPLAVPKDKMLGENTVTPLYQSQACAVFRSLRDAVAGLTAGAPFLSYVSLVDNKLPRAVGVAYAILDFVCRDNIVDSQRRRLPGRGR